MKWVKPLLLVVGLGLMAGLVATNQPAEIFASMARLSWKFGILLCFPVTLVMIFDTLGWRYAFVRDRVAFSTLAWVRLAGEAFNLATPTITIAQGLLLLLGIVLAWYSALGDSPLLWAMLGLLAVEILGLSGFVLVQTQGMFERGRRLLERFGLRSLGGGHTARRVDHGLAWFYRREPRRLVLSIAFHFVAWLLGALEAYLILRFLGADVSLATAVVIEAFGTGIRFVTFMIPGSLGALEGGYVAMFVALGLSPAAGVSFGLTRRVRELVWVLAGLAVFAVMRPERPTLSEITRAAGGD